VPIVAPASTLPGLGRVELQRWPHVLAVPLAEYARESVPYVKLHRLTDAAETLTRFCTVVALGDLHDRNPQQGFPEAVRQELQGKLDRPTFGAWRDLLRATVEALPYRGSRRRGVLAEMSAFVEQRLLPLLADIIPLRNRLAHCGRLTEAEERGFLEGKPPLKGYPERLQKLLTGTTPFTQMQVVGSAEVGQAFLLHGVPAPGQSFPPFDTTQLPTGTESPRPDRLLLLADDRVLDLFPLHAYADVFHYLDRGRAETRAAGEDRAADPRAFFERVPEASPAALLYFRRGTKDYLEYTAFSPHAAHSQEGFAALERFKQVFRLEEWRGQAEARAARSEFDFSPWYGELLELFVGRDEQVRQVNDWIKQATTGLCWLHGHPGVGKSAFVAKLGRDYFTDERKVCKLVHFFRAIDPRCSRMKFLENALTQLGAVFGRAEPIEADPRKRMDQFSRLLTEVSQAEAAKPERERRRILFLLDGLDEVCQHERDFPDLIFRHRLPGVVWLCAGRGEFGLAKRFRQAQAHLPFGEGGLPGLTEGNVREVLDHECGRQIYELIGRDHPNTPPGGNANPFLEELVRRSGGLPLYLRLLVQDIREGRLSFKESEEKKLPHGLTGYYERILERLQVSDVSAVLTPVVCLLALAKAPLTFDAIESLMAEHWLLRRSGGRDLLRRALDFGHLMLKRVTVTEPLSPEGSGGVQVETGYTLYHESLREHLLASKTVEESMGAACDGFCRFVLLWHDWRKQLFPYRYALRHGPKHLVDANRSDQLDVLAREAAFLQAQAAIDPHAPLDTLQGALQAAATRDDAPKMAEFCLAHAQWTSASQKSPLDTLRAGDLGRAWRLADLYDSEHSILWHLLLALELRDAGRTADATGTLNRLKDKRLPTFSGWRAKMAAALLARVTASEEVFPQIREALADEGREALIRRLISGGQWEVALETGKSLRGWKREVVLRDIATAQARAGQFIPALETAEEIRTSGYWPEVMWAAAASQARAGDYSGALMTARRIENQSARDWALREIGQAQAEARKFEAALDTIPQILSPTCRAAVLQAVAAAQAAAGECAAAFRSVQQIEKDGNPTAALRDIAVAQARAGNLAGARETFAAAAATAQRITGSPGWNAKADALVQIAEAQARVREFGSALLTAQSISDQEFRGFALTKIAKAQAENGNFIDALGTTQQVHSHEGRLEILRDLGVAQAKAGDQNGARATLAAALEIAKEFGGHRQAYELKWVAVAQARAGDVAGALASVQQMDRTGTWTAANESEWAEALTLIAETQHKEGNGLGAHTTLALALAHAPDAETESGQVERCVAQGAVFMKAGKRRQAQVAYAGARATIRSMKHPEDRAEALMALAQQRRAAGDKKGRTTLAAAVKAARRVASKPDRVGWLARIGLSQAEFGDGEGARATFEIATKTARKIRNGPALASVALAQVLAGERNAAHDTFATALRMARRLYGDRERADALSEIGVRQAQAGMYDLALATAKGANHEDCWQKILAAVAAAQAEAGQLDTALAMAQSLTDGWPQEALPAIARAQARVAEFTAALETVQKIDYAYERAEVLRVIAAERARRGETPAARALFTAALTEARQTAWIPGRAEHQCDIAEWQAQVGLGEDAVRTAEAILTDRHQHLPEIAAALAAAGDRENFKRLLIPCAYYPEAAYRIFGLLPQVYPEQAGPLAVIAEGLGQSRRQAAPKTSRHVPCVTPVTTNEPLAAAPPPAPLDPDGQADVSSRSNSEEPAQRPHGAPSPWWQRCWRWLTGKPPENPPGRK
jgi:tetratricopeptide (TPR) repeat protein